MRLYAALLGIAAAMLACHPGSAETALTGLGKADAASAINALLASGADVELPAGQYALRSRWIEMRTPGQVLRCKGPNTTLVVDRPGTTASPALIMTQAAVGAKVIGCKFDMNGGQFVNTAFAPLASNDAIKYVPGTGLVDNPQGKAKANDGMAVAVLVMCDRCEIAEAEVTRGFDNNIMVANFDLSNGKQSLGPWGVSIRDTRTSYAGAGRHNWDPDYYQGCGIDIGSGVAARLTNVEDRYSRIGFCVDEGGGASAQIVNAASFNAQVTQKPFLRPDKMSSYYPAADDPWHGSSIAGTGFFFGGSDRRANLGQVQPGLISTTCINCLAYEPQGVGFWFSRYSNGAHLVSPHAASPGLECFWAVGGSHYLTDAICDQPNALAGSTKIWGGKFPWPRTAAVRASCANCGPFSSLPAIRGTPDQLNTTLHFNGLTMTDRSPLDAAKKPNFAYSFSTAPGNKDEFSRIQVLRGNIQPGTSGFIDQGDGTKIEIIDGK